MILASCTHCHRTWEYRTEERPSEEQRGPAYTSQETPCFHKFTLDPIPPNTRGLFTEIPYIPTLPDTLEVEFIAMLFEKEVRNRNFIKFYYDIIDENLVESPYECESFLHETVHYRGHETEHYAYFESENTLYCFTVPQLRVLAYLYKKEPIALTERIEEWYKENNSLAEFHRTMETFEREEGTF